MTDATDRRTITPASAEAWCAKLDSGEYEQVSGHLYGATPEGGKGYCCLGVFALAHGAVFKRAETREDQPEDQYEEWRAVVSNAPFGRSTTVSKNELLGNYWAEQVGGLNSDQQRFLSLLNDGRKAAVLQSNPLRAQYVKYARSVTPATNYKAENVLICHFEKHTFKEIAKVIRDEFVKL